MKKTIALLLSVLTVLLLAVPALALTGYELFTRWEQDGYPEDVTGVFYNTETQCLAILLTDNTEARQKAIRESLTDGDTLTFFTGRYSHAELEAVRDVIAADVENGEPGLVSVSIGWGSSGGYGEEQKDFRVVVKAEREHGGAGRKICRLRGSGGRRGGAGRGGYPGGCHGDAEGAAGPFRLGHHRDRSDGRGAHCGIADPRD